MKWLKKAVLLAIVLLISQNLGLSSQSHDRPARRFQIKTIPPGRLSRIVYLSAGKAVFLRARPTGETYLSFSDNHHLSEQLVCHGDFNLRKDRTGTVWMAGISGETSSPQLILQKIAQKPCLILPLVNQNQQIYASSLDFAFDLANQAVFVWLQRTTQQFSLKGYSSFTGTTWEISHPSLTSASFPRILIDQGNRIWLFWVGNERENDDIFVTYFDGTHWAPVTCLTTSNPYPDIFPQIKEDPSGQIWLVWSGYDGHDYEIYSRVFNGLAWSKTRQLTNNTTGDSAPSLIITPAFPLIFWIQTEHNTSFLAATYWQEEKEGSSRILFKSHSPLYKIYSAAQNGQVSLLLQGIKDSTLLTTTLEQIISSNETFTLKAEEPSSVPVVNPELNDSYYIGFGDSITYGYIDYHEAPDLGYIPRLQEMLIQHYGEGLVINEGWPGETTVHGVTRIEEVLTTHQAQYLLLMEGTNDIIFQEISTDTSEFNLQEMIKKSKEYGVYVIITTIIPRNDWRWKRVYYRERIYDLNDRIRHLADQEKIPLIDFFNIFYNYPEEDGGWTSLLSTDKVHPSEKGYQLMAESWFAEIKLTPFPPQDIRVLRVRDGLVPVPHTANVIIWQPNKKLDNDNYFLLINIYRRDRTHASNQFELIYSLPCSPKEVIKTGVIGFPSFNNFSFQFVDRGIDQQKKYEYMLSLIRQDEVEGPPSKPVREEVVFITLKEKRLSSPIFKK